jgi:uncharacterized protein YegJ (DUF2314 family)
VNLAELLSSLASWPTLLIAIVVYGFAPGFLLRLIVLAYEKGDERRDELVAELYAVERIKRPFWVAEQLETALFDGLGPRLRWAATGRIILRWRLDNGVKRNRQYPDTFGIPSDEEKADLVPGVAVKLMFNQSDGWAERMWVQIDKIGRCYLVGYLVNTPLGFPRLDSGRRIRFRRDHIIDIAWDYEPGPLDHFDVRALCGACGGSEPSPATEASDHGPACGCQLHGPTPDPTP